MLLVLGRPSSGCTTLLKTLAGQTQGIHVEGSERINYQGISYRKMHHSLRGERMYLAEFDEHFPELTVGETLSFAAATRETAADRKAAALSMSRNFASLFDLTEVFHTKIGSAVIRGVSGGEKKRTSIAEAFIGGSPLQCWDNSTRGLDASTALNFVELLKTFTTVRQSTTIVSIYQASDPMFNGFDKVTLLYHGRQIYFGPTVLAPEYFIDLGFEKSARATNADFLTSITHPAERRIRQGYENRVPRSPDEFADAWKRSSEARVLSAEIEKFDVLYSQEDGAIQGGNGDDSFQKYTFSMSIWRQVVICVQRGFCRLRNNYVPVVAGVFGNTVIAIVVGSVFYDLGETSASLDSRAVLIFFALMVNAFAPAFEILTMWAQRPIVEKHARYAFYHPFVEGIASIWCDLPNKVATSILFNVCVYFMTNLRRTSTGFFIFYLFVFLTIMTMSMFFRMVGSLSKTIEQTMAPMAVVILIFIVYTGFVVPVNDMVHWLSWLRRLNPMAFAYESLMINEFHGRQFPCAIQIPEGPNYSQEFGPETVCAAMGANPGERDVMGSSYLLIKYGYQRSHLWRNLWIIVAMFLVFGATHLLAAEYIPAQRSKGEVLVFRRRHPKKGTHIDGENRISGNKVQDFQDGIQSAKDIPSRVNMVPTMQKQSAVFHWRNIDYEIKSRDGTRKILNDVNGWVKPGTLTALMGVTGAGKTSLLDVLACRTSIGVLSGEVYVGARKRGIGFQRETGYVQQEDIHLPTSTVREALEFSALLRQPKTRSIKERLEYVSTVLSILNMESYADAVVGSQGEGLNVEQRKRLTIAVELAARPEVLLFLDEPTSGLDSQTAWSVCTLLRELANNGQAVLCTIHQPSSQLFQLFDRLLLLDKHGQTLYFGDIGHNSSVMIDYFERYGANKCHFDMNPAEWVLATTKSQVMTRRDNENSVFESWSDVWNTSQQKQRVMEHLQELLSTSPGTETILPNEHTEQYAASYSRQLAIVSKRIFQDYWRDPVYIYSKLALCVGVALFNGLSFHNTALTIQGLTNIFFSVFLISQLFSTIDQQVIPRLESNRGLFEAREGRSKTYSWMVFISANILVELFWQTFASILIFATWYYPTGMWRNGDPSFGAVERGALTFGLIWLFCLWISTFSQAVAIGIEHAETAVQIATLIFWLSLVFCGVLVPPGELPRFWVFVYRASPLTYFIDGIVAAGLANTSLRCSESELLHLIPPSDLNCVEYLGPYMQTAGGYLDNSSTVRECLYCPFADSNAFLSSRGIDITSPWKNFGYLIVYVLFNMLSTFFIFRITRLSSTKIKKRQV